MTTVESQDDPGGYGLYRPEFEHGACGVGLVASTGGARSHDMVEKGLQVLVNLAHRGATGSDPRTGDGAGILLQMPDAFARREAAALGISLPSAGRYGLGMVFLPRDQGARARAEAALEEAVREEGQLFLGWRDVPLDPSQVGARARETMPVIRQALVAAGPAVGDQQELERRLFLARKVAEGRAAGLGPEASDFYVCSLSTNRVVYKGLLMGTQLRGFYPDLADPELVSGFAMVHSRFGTNTLGTWRLAHPYRCIIHNGEINTLRGNINWMVARQASMSSPLFGDDIGKLFPVIAPRQSDTASIDNAIELLMHTGRPLPQVMMMLVPEATGERVRISQERRDFYDYQACTMEPWDGPALIVFTDGTRVGAVLDRNGLRPCRYLLTRDGLLVMASEVGVLDIPPEDVVFKERLAPGRMVWVDPERGGLLGDTQVKAEVAASRPYGRWLRENRVSLEELPLPATVPYRERASLESRQRAFGYTQEELRMLMAPMAVSAAEPVGSMGNDTPLAVLSEKPQNLFSYFKQLFAQVSNPPLDAIREGLVTSLEVTLGRQGNIFQETPEHARKLRLPSPVLDDADLERVRALDTPALRSTTISTLFPADGGPGALEEAVERLCAQASRAIGDGHTIIILSDRGVDPHHAPIPSLLATAAVHHHLIRQGTRTSASLVVESGEPREIPHLALLIGYGASAVNPYLALETLQQMSARCDLGEGSDPETARKRYIKAAEKGLLKVISKMGTSTIQGYCGAQVFEAVGLGQGLVDRHFTWTPSRVGGIGAAEIQEETLRRHRLAFREAVAQDGAGLDQGGAYYWRRDGEYHMWNPDAIARLQFAARFNDAGAYREFARLANEHEGRLCTLRGLLELRQPARPVPLEEVEPASEIVKRFATGAISLGAISREAHETLAIAMNRIGARSNSGEGGEDYTRFARDPNGDLRSSAVKQVASGRFGVTANYLVNATDLQIKMAQGAKPGEGGQLPGHKVDEYIGWVRHSTPGVELISPPPHHDIYSIEDLAQLIHDLKSVNSSARIHVKLVAEVGVGTIAAGVAKARADVVLISGDSGGTGASPESSIKHAGLPWELGIAEAQQVLVSNDLRGRIVVQADGQIKTGRDVAIACLLGAEEFGIATAALVTLGCVMLRKCHLNACSVGIATQDPELRRRFAGQPQHLINYFLFVAEELREIMASLGFRTVNEMVGRADMLEPRRAMDHWKARGIDLGSLLYMPEARPGVATYHIQDQDHGLEGALDHQLLALARDALEHRTPVEASFPIRNPNRTVGAMLSGAVARLYAEEGLPEDTIRCRFTGSAGQSFGAFLARGITFTLEGDANDYFGKGLSGGRLVAVHPAGATFVPEENIIVGNVCLYGATGGEAYVRGLAGERFCVRNSGARAVVEGVGDHGCEYMTSGLVAVLGPTGRNFAAGMSGGIAYVLDEAGDFPLRCNQEMVDLEPVSEPQDQEELLRMVEDHYRYTGSASARRLLSEWDTLLPRFVKVYPRDYRRVMEERKRAQREGVASGLERVSKGLNSW